MIPLSFEDARWNELKAGYRVPFDLRPLLGELESGEDPESTWQKLWQELYEFALRDLAQLGLAELPRASDREAVRSILAILAIAHDARTYGRILAEFSEDELLDLEKQAFGDLADDSE